MKFILVNKGEHMKNTNSLKNNSKPVISGEIVLLLKCYYYLAGAVLSLRPPKLIFQKTTASTTQRISNINPNTYKNNNKVSFPMESLSL